MATGPNFAPPLPLMQPPACRLLDPPNSPPIDPFLADRLRNHRHLAIAPQRRSVRPILLSPFWRHDTFARMNPGALKNEQNERKDDFYETTLEWLIDKGVLTREMSVLVVCAGQFDRDVLLKAGFTDVTISNLDSRWSGYEFSPFRWSCQDAEKLEFPDDEYDFCIAHDGLHHCASPHRALLEMFRVAKKGVLVFEPRD